MSDKKFDKSLNEKFDDLFTDEQNKFIKFSIDKPFRMFVGEIKGSTVQKISPDKLEGFKDGDKVVVMHNEDWLWFFNELTDTNKGKPINIMLNFDEIEY